MDWTCCFLLLLLGAGGARVFFFFLRAASACVAAERSGVARRCGVRCAAVLSVARVLAAVRGRLLL